VVQGQGQEQGDVNWSSGIKADKQKFMCRNTVSRQLNIFILMHCLLAVINVSTVFVFLYWQLVNLLLSAGTLLLTLQNS